MQFTKERLGLRLYSDVRKEFPRTSIEGDTIVVCVDDVEVRISLNMLLAEIKHENINYKTMLNNYKDIIREIVEENNFKIDYHKLYPVIRSSKFGLDESVKFYRRPLFLDLDILYVTDYPSLIKFLMVTDKFDTEKAHEGAMFNINKIKNSLKQINPLLEIYSTEFNSDYNCSLLFNSNFIKEIKKTVGLSSYLMAIPSSSTILIARDFKGNAEILKELIQNDENPNVISDHVYRVSKGEYYYAD